MMFGLPWMNSSFDGRIMGHEWRWGGGFAWIIPIAIWSILWTGLALWHAARRGQKGWFVFFLLVHTAGIIELIYLILVVKVFEKKKRKKTR